MEQKYFDIASHDVKGLLTSIKAYSYLLQKRLRQQKDEKSLFYLEKIDKQATALMHQINSFADMARLQTNTLHIYPQVTNITTLLQECSDEISQQVAITNTHPQEITIDKQLMKRAILYVLHEIALLDPTLPTVTITVDHTALQTEIHITLQSSRILPLEKARILGPIEPMANADLFIVQSILLQHHGLLRITSQTSEIISFILSIQQT